MTDLEPILQTAGLGGGALAALWLLVSKVRAMAASDGASAGKSAAENRLYETLSAENSRMAVRIAENDLVLQGMRSDMDLLQRRCDAERLEAFNEINKLNKRVDELNAAVAQCQARHLEKDAQDELGRTGQIDRRKPQTPRGRRSPP